MSAAAKRYLPLGLVVLVSAGISLTSLVLAANLPSAGPGDYPADAGPAVNALAHGHLSAFLNAHYVMGPFSLLLRAPFAALAGSDQLAAYRWGCLPCVLAAGLLGLYLAGLARRREATQLTQVVIVGICLVNPLTFESLQMGHPEEILTAALAVGAVAVASEGHSRRAALLLGLAIASKQWAVIAIFPVLMALPAKRFRVALGAAGIVLALMIPVFVADPHYFLAAQQNVASTHRFVDAWNIWYPVAGATTDKVVLAGGHAIVHPFEGGSTLIGRYAHSLVILTAIAAPLAIALRRRRFSLSGADAMALLALLALVRCALDPVNNLYYHAPLLLALVGWDAVAPRGLPLRALTGVAVATLFWRLPPGLSDPRTLNALYLAAVVPAGMAIALTIGRRPGSGARRVPAQRTAATGAARAG